MKVIIVEQLHLKVSLLSVRFSEITSNCYSVLGTKMAQSAPLILRLVASSITAVNRAGKIIRDVMNQGDLGIVEKVGRGVPCTSIPFFWHTYFSLTALCGRLQLSQKLRPACLNTDIVKMVQLVESITAYASWLGSNDWEI